MSDDLSIRGSLEESSLPELLRSVTRSHETGVLTCFIHDAVKAIYIQEGQIIFASSTNPDDRLGESLLKHGTVPLKPLLEASRIVKTGRRLGSVLCDMNVLTPEDLVEGVRQQIRDIILSLFKVVKGGYELAFKEVDTHEMILLNISTEDIIFDGVKSIDKWHRIHKGLGPLHGKLIPTEEASKIILNLTLDADEQHLFSLCQKGQFTIEEICTMSYMSDFDTCRHLWAFMMVGVLNAQDTPERHETDAVAATAVSADMEYEFHDLVENYNDLFAHVYDYAFNRVEDKAEGIAKKAMEQVQLSVPQLFGNIALDSYGRIDSDSLMRNMMAISSDGKLEMVAGALEEILYALLYEVGSYFGSEDQKKLTQEVQSIRKK
ncbi:MAG TPA: DUF4388 domain-containing protein [Acidobacteriota bacterium]|nr:DUF4388 domain-containing protein [Acidobacteriota bacterium]